MVACIHWSDNGNTLESTDPCGTGKASKRQRCCVVFMRPGSLIRSHEFQSNKRKVGLRESIGHFSLNANKAAAVWPMTADALGRVLEICKNWNTQCVFNTHRRNLQRTRRNLGDTNRWTRSWRDALQQCGGSLPAATTLSLDWVSSQFHTNSRM